jgi:hypothetical protein
MMLSRAEIKSSTTFNSSFLSGFDYWRKHIDEHAQGIVIYGGDNSQQVRTDELVSWNKMEQVFKKIT